MIYIYLTHLIILGIFLLISIIGNLYTLLIFIIALILISLLGFLLGAYRKVPFEKQPNLRINFHISKNIFLFTTALAIIFWIISYSELIADFENFNIFNLMRDQAIGRYSGEGEAQQSNLQIKFFTYFAMLSSSLSIISAFKYRNLNSFICYAINLFTLIFPSASSLGIVIPLCLSAPIIFLSNNSDLGFNLNLMKPSKIFLKNIRDNLLRTFFIVLVIVLTFSSFVIVSRVDINKVTSSGVELIGPLIGQKLMNYTLSPILNMDYFLKNIDSFNIQPFLTIGRFYNTLIGASQLGLGLDLPGVNSSFLDINIFNSNLYSNLFFLIHDIKLSGTFILIFIYGFNIGSTFHSSISKYNIYFAIIVSPYLYYYVGSIYSHSITIFVALTLLILCPFSIKKSFPTQNN